jgi:hypothetical protein
MLTCQHHNQHPQPMRGCRTHHELEGHCSAQCSENKSQGGSTAQHLCNMAAQATNYTDACFMGGMRWDGGSLRIKNKKWMAASVLSAPDTWCTAMPCHVMHPLPVHQVFALETLQNDFGERRMAAHSNSSHLRSH